MTTLDDRLIPKTLDIVNRFGKSAVFTVLATERTYDPTTGNSSLPTSSTVTRKVTPPEAYRQQYIDGETIQAGDMRVYLPASGLTFTPCPDMLVTMDSKAWRIMAVGPIYSGEQIAMYELQLRT